MPNSYSKSRDHILTRCKSLVGKIVPTKVINCFFKAKRLFVYTNYDSTAYWKKRAQDPGQAAVLWKNQEYNALYRIIQKKILYEFLPEKSEKAVRILDIGCGIGIVSKMLVDYHPLIHVDAVDFPEMIQIAKQQSPSPQISYIESSAEDYCNRQKEYDFIISSACFSAIRNIPTMEKAIMNCTKMLDEKGIIIMIDPFHRWKYLARVKYNSKDVEKYLNKLGFKLIHKSGVLFWPYRELLANSTVCGDALERRFFQGEWLLSKLGNHYWADYKILAFRKQNEQ